MKGDAKIIDLLNEVLTGELTAINQYFLHGRMCDNWGYKRLGEKIRKESIDEMKHADRLILRILFLEGLPNVQKLGKLAIGQTAVEILKSEEEHVDWLEEQLEIVKQIGEAHYLAQQVRE